MVQLPFKLYHIHDFLSTPGLPGFFYIEIFHSFWLIIHMKSIYPILFILILSCSSTIPGKNNWEGIRGSFFRVAVYQFTADEDDLNKVKENIVEAGKRRAALLLISYSSLVIERSRVNAESDALLNKVIIEIIEQGKPVSMDFKDTGYALAFIEYDITTLTEALNEINRDNSDYSNRQ